MENFNLGWKYHREGDDTVQLVDLPHDGMIGSPRRKDAPSGAAGAYFEGGVYHYTKEFYVPKEWKEKNVYLAFGGVYRKAKIFINSVPAFEWAYGYTGFHFQADEYLNYGAENVIEVVADNSEQPNSRWYTGGGIYRPVKLIVKNKTHFALGGVRVETVSIDPARIRVSAKRTGGTVSFSVYGGETQVGALDREGELTIENAKLWSAETPNLYRLKAVLTENGAVVDEEELDFGIRTLGWSPKGFFVNGKSVLLRGGCVHHDNGILGARAFPEAEERKARLLKQAGFNAVRFSHNPCSKEFAAACDKVGLYLIDEYADMWYMRKKKYDYALDFPAWHQRDLAAMVEKDFNHPSVIMYSIGNEVSEPCEEKGMETAKELTALLHTLDGTRPVTAGINLFIVHGAQSGQGQYCEANVEADALPKEQPQEPMSSEMFNMMATQAGPAMNNMANSDEVDEITTPILDLLDIAGYNYASGRYDLEGSKHPNRVLYGSETFPQDIYRNWQKVKALPYLVGDFMWTAVDYLGEVGIGGWHYETQYGMGFEKPYPWIIADTGAIDIIGTIGAEAKYAGVVWGLEDKPYIGVSPLNQDKAKLVKSVWRGTNVLSSWAWQGCEGVEADIEVYTQAAYVELYLNGRKLGQEKVNECKACFQAAYEPGTLTAVALDEDLREVSHSELRSARSIGIALACERRTVVPGEVVFIDVCLADGDGVVESNADQELTATIEGGALLAFGAAEQKTLEPYSSNKTRTYYGRALLVAKASGDGPLVVTVASGAPNSVPAVLTLEKG